MSNLCKIVLFFAEYYGSKYLLQRYKMYTTYQNTPKYVSLTYDAGDCVGPKYNWHVSYIV